MKNTYLGIAAIILLAVLTFAFKGSDAVQYGTADTPDYEGAMEFEYGPGLDALRPYKAFPVDTITNTEKDTLTVPFTFASRFTESLHFTFNTLTGTRSLKVYLDEANVLSGVTGWATVDSLTPAATTNEMVILRPEVYGRKQRIRVGGVTGTQSLQYTVTAAYKKRN